MAKKKYYAVLNGRIPGIYMDWDSCKKNVDGFKGAIYKSFPTIEEAKAFMEGETPSPSANATKSSASKANTSGDVNLDASDSSKEHFIAYVDGSYNDANKKVGLGALVFADGKEIEISREVEANDLISMRNVAGEIKASEAAIKYALDNGAKKITIIHDYEGIAKWCNGQWKANLEGTKAYRDFYLSVKDKIEVVFVKVKGHSGNKYNDVADNLAKKPIF